MKVAVAGANISGLLSAYELAKSGVKVVVYEKEHYLGGHPNTVTINGVDLDLGFMVFNRVTYPNLMEFFEFLGVDMEISDMSFSVSLEQGCGCEWGTRNGFSSLFAQKKNVLNPYFWQIIREIIRFKQDVISYLEELYNNPDIDCNETLGQFIGSHGYSVLFMKAYLVPICASIWSCRSEGVMGFFSYSILSFCRDHHLLQVKEELEKIACQIRTGCEVNSVLTNEQGCSIACNDGATEVYDGCTIAVHAPDTLKMLGKESPQLLHQKLHISYIKSKGREEYGFVEHIKAGLVAADGMLRRNCSVLYNPKHLVPTWPETGARLLVTRFFKSYIQTGLIIEDEDLKVAQLRKISLLIEKAKISKEHHILEIGFGWGTLAMEVVKQTGCKYTSITLSEKQLEYAQLRVEQAGLQV
ncbi:hypothetical protein R3W88_012035 [Solanum pinnatisectum]|uniref:Cyclopropane-fatty-acyl-phospholipid synthase n=1 Tax=Solanum pinnatisectum TaxID=50273 RepID=A0AAV9L958_9SOLN|nr:hypothetical protein R3W88_012035 [Solanum pinnatisectum]